MGNNSRHILTGLLITICLVSILITSCTSSPIIPSTFATIPTSTELSTPSATVLSIPTSGVLPTSAELPITLTATTLGKIDEPRFLIFLGDRKSTSGGDLVFSPDGLIIAQADTSLKLWNVNTHKLIKELNYQNYNKFYATRTLFSPDGNLVAVSITIHPTNLGSTNVHLLIWDVYTGELKQDWEQENAIMSAYNELSDLIIYNIPVDAMTFFPSSTKLAYASGNRIEVKDAISGEKITSWSLGDKMYASDMTTTGDGEFLYILMKWYKDRISPSKYYWKFKAQTWHPATKSIRQEINYEDVDISNASMWLIGQALLYEDKNQSSLYAYDFLQDKRKEFPYRIGWKYFNADANLMFVIRYVGVDENKQGIEIWNTDTWRNLYTFRPSFIDNWFLLSDVAFSPENSLMAIDYDGQISLWNIRPSIQP